MTTTPETPPIVTRLRRAIEEGEAFTSRPNLILDAASMWTMKVRGILTQLYGKDTPEVDAVCPKPTPEERISPTVIIRARLGALRHLERSLNAISSKKVFIGHGRSSEWLKLHRFLTSALGLDCDEFNTEPAAGLQTSTRIDQMLSTASMAFLVMAAEDEHADGTLHARENVIHEIGLFQARLGPHRAIVLLETGCSRFANLDGLTTIDFPRGDIMARTEQVRGVLAREGAR